MKKYAIEIKWALIFVVVALLWMLMEKLSGLHSTHIDKHPIYTNLFAIPAIAMYVFALLDKKKNFYSGNMSYKEGFISGLIITIIVTLLSPITQIITSEIITPEYFPNAIEYAIISGQMKPDAAREHFSLKTYIIFGFFGALAMGIVTTAIVAFFTKSKKNI